ncbi:MAG: hypothetical protein AB7Q29_13495 [Vicinamibacterales bacterium]
MTKRLQMLVLGLALGLLVTTARAQIPTRSTGFLVTADAWNQLVNQINTLTTGGIAIASQTANDLIVATGGSQLGRLAKGTSLQYLRMNSGADGIEWATPVAADELIAIIEDQKTQGTSGGQNTPGSDQKRTLNTLAYNKYGTGVVSLSSSQFTITPSGTQTFVIMWSVPFGDVGPQRNILYRTDPSAAEVGRGPSAIQAEGMAVVELSAATTYEVRHRTTTQRSDGFGSASGFGTEIYTRVRIYRRST